MGTQYEELQFQDIPLPEITDLEGLDDILDLGSDGSSSFYSPSESPVGSPFSFTGNSSDVLSQSSSPEPSCYQFLPSQDSSASSDTASSTGKTPKRKSKKTKTRKTVRSGESKNKRNERERKRVKKLSDAFESLRDSVPFLSGNKKQSKLETLKNALNYIYYLDNLLYYDQLQVQHQQLPDQVIIPALPVLGVIDCQNTGVQLWPYRVAVLQQ